MFTDKELKKIKKIIDNKKSKITLVASDESTKAYSLNLKKGSNVMMFNKVKRSVFVDFKGVTIINGKIARELFAKVESNYKGEIKDHSDEKKDKAIADLLLILE